MTNTEIIQAIKAEIERRKGYISVTHFAEELLSFLSTLESEKPMNLDELMKEAQRYYFDNFEYLSSDQPTLSILTNIASHFAEWGAEHNSSSEIPKDLEEAAEDFVWEVMENDEDGISDLCRKLRPTSKISDFYDALAEFFIAGAKWQAEHLKK